MRSSPTGLDSDACPYVLDTNVLIHLRDGDPIPALAFDAESADAYRDILASAGYSRRKLLDRMIAAQAIVHRATLVTKNPADFSDIPGLSVLAW